MNTMAHVHNKKQHCYQDKVADQFLCEHQKFILILIVNLKFNLNLKDRFELLCEHVHRFSTDTSCNDHNLLYVSVVLDVLSSSVLYFVELAH